MGYILPMNHYGDRQFRNRIENQKTSGLKVHQINKVEKIQFNPQKRSLNPSRGNDIQFDRYI